MSGNRWFRMYGDRAKRDKIVSIQEWTRIRSVKL